MMKLILNTIALITLIASANALAQISAPYGVFNPLAMFEQQASKQAQQANSAFYNYGNKGYDFVVESAFVSAPKLPQQFASLDR
ncbi:MAG: hypothetical protein PSN35_03955 [Candidatus Thioglobus sp.]|uniref:hypothetical protein n=1 Tax=Candidatus Thioglobus sp. TaxID=2026721 RepID=UPI0026157021|nr:hypothetical protein [Candidatus Thioglobus sp.]MDC9726972.1 hypothetical protein [Candidatus Thioglobus sp.]